MNEQVNTRRTFAPATDIHETADEYALAAEVPGADPESIDVTYEGGVLTLRARTAEISAEGFALAVNEFADGDYERAFEVSDRVDADAIEARYEHGVLNVRLPKAKPETRKVIVVTS